jgi:hypothetical protein
MASADYVEYMTDGGAGGGVIYQGPPLNDARFGTSSATVCQSAKLLFEEGIDPYLALMNVSSDPDHRVSARFRAVLFDPGGRRMGGGEIGVPAFSARVTALRSLLDDPAYTGGALLLGAAGECNLAPISFLRDRRSHALAIDHTLPPQNYHSAWASPRRRAAWAGDLFARLESGRL